MKQLNLTPHIGCAPEDFAGAARREALRMKADITSVL